MSKKFTCVAAVLLLHLSTPAPAAAQFWDVIRWFNDMSGPQMLGFSIDVPVYCQYEDNGEPATLFECTQFKRDGKGFPTGPRRDLSSTFRVGYLSNTKLFGDPESIDRGVGAIVLGAGVSKSLIPTARKPSVQVDGLAALDFVRFLGPGVDDFWVPTLNVGAALRYGGEDKRSALKNGIRVSLRYQKFFDTFDGAKFSAPGTFVSEREGIWQFTVGWILF